MADFVQDASQYLKQVIRENGFSSLEKEPFALYQTIRTENRMDDVHARVLLNCLLGLDFRLLNGNPDSGKIAGNLQKNCCLTRECAEEMAAMFAQLYGEDNQKEWAEKEYAGLREFLCKDWDFSWDGESEWHRGGGYVECTASVSVSARAAAPELVENACKAVLKENPFTTAQQLHDFINGQFCGYLDGDFEDYCTCDDYYPPVVEDYGTELESDVADWFQKRGLKVTAYDSDGDMSDYIPESAGRRGW